MTIYGHYAVNTTRNHGAKVAHSRCSNPIYLLMYSKFLVGHLHLQNGNSSRAVDKVRVHIITAQLQDHTTMEIKCLSQFFFADLNKNTPISSVTVKHPAKKYKHRIGSFPGHKISVLSFILNKMTKHYTPRIQIVLLSRENELCLQRESLAL